MSDNYCPECGEKNLETAIFCQNCGNNLQNETKKELKDKTHEIKKFDSKLRNGIWDIIDALGLELKAKVPEKVSGHFKKSGNTQDNRNKVLSLFVIAILGISVVTLAIALTAPKSTYLTMNQYYPQIGNNTTYTLKGTTEAGATVIIYSNNLNLPETKVNVDSSGNFEYKVNVPLNMDEAQVFIKANAPSKKEELQQITIQRSSNKVSISTTTLADTESQYKASCKVISYKVLEKNPDAHIGEKIKLKGKIVQIMESWGSTVIRMDVNSKFGDTVYITYNGTTPALEDDIITVYGEVYGRETYESQVGFQITLPGIRASYIDINKS